MVALAIAGGWIGTQRRSISTLEQESALLEKSIATRSIEALGESSQGKPALPGKGSKTKDPIDWKKVAAQFAEMNQSGGMGDMRAAMRFQQRLQAMSRDELVLALDEIAALDLPKDTRSMLEQMIISPLAGKDPEYVLTRCIGSLDEKGGSMGWQLSAALQEWAKKDPAKATTWFDQQIAAGKLDSKSLDGKSRSRGQFEGALIGILLSSDPDAAGRRLDGLPEDQRADSLGSFSYTPVKEADQAAFAKMIRDHLPAGEQAEVVARQVSHLVTQEGFTQVDEYLSRINATPGERTACAEEAAEWRIQRLGKSAKITGKDLDRMRQWTATQAPDATDSITGKALARATQGGRDKLDFAEGAALAVQYHQTSGNDDVLASFLEHGNAHANKEAARAIAEKISDPKRRQQFLKRFE